MKLTGLEVPILIFAVFSFILLTYKSIKKRDISIFGAAIPRLFVALMMGLEIYSGLTQPFLVRTALILLLLSDTITGMLHYIVEKQMNKTYGTVISSLRQKLSAALDGSFSPFFTIDTTGRIEYLNDSLANLVGLDKEYLIGNNLLKLLEITNTVEELKKNGIVECNIKTKDGYRKAKIIGKETQNGHITITGSIYFL
jgi:PAS domain S-box-containing protein